MATETLTGHLLELRKRLLRIVISFIIIFLCLIGFSNELYTVFASPLLNALPEGSHMIATDVASPFLTPFKLTAVIAGFIIMPYFFYEIWAFIAPGLYQNEKKWVVSLLLSSVVLFYLGMAFAYLAVFPIMFQFFSLASPEGVDYTPDIAVFLNTSIKLFFSFGFAFEIPVICILLIKKSIYRAEDLARKRPFIFIGCFIVGMLLTPPDPISQVMMAIPIWLLFEVGVLIGKQFEKQQPPA